MNDITTTVPVTLDGWYQLTNGLYGFFAGAARGVGPRMTWGPCHDYECVKLTETGSIYEIGWPARSLLARAAGVEPDALTERQALTALKQLREQAR